jgi:hypothetical protein
MVPLILKRTSLSRPSGQCAMTTTTCWRTASSSAASSRCQSHRRTAIGCREADMAARYAARRAAISRRHDAVVGQGGQPCALGTKVRTNNRSRFSPVSGDLSSCDRVPHPDSSIPRCRHHLCPVGGKSSAVDRTSVALECDGRTICMKSNWPVGK